MATRTTSGRSVATRRPAMASARSALAFDRAPLQVDGRQSCWASNHRSSSSPTVRNGAARRTAGTRRTGRPVHGGAPRRLSALRGTRTNAARSGPTPGRPDSDADLEHAGPSLPQRSPAPGAHDAESRVISRVTGGSLLMTATRVWALTRNNALSIQRAWRDSNPQPSDPYGVASRARRSPDVANFQATDHVSDDSVNDMRRPGTR
jgi:hypothetical protein